MKTTISINTEVKDEINEFGKKGETYSDILKRILKKAKEMQIREILMDDNDSDKIENALYRAKKRWQ
ncbi:hypothetical protein HOD20_07605 [archaeon]|jgi:predicted CopG family antitoxin|nr:hypothetical protein [archaeon]MBT4352373.1 hypothetical protein [archaeon]MBT4646973.1 hypothetical protein [archaeon]MBT6822568.1 hypothetical protein [archaeon]MBT7392753.1 hypothetical protein [archaeon]